MKSGKMWTPQFWYKVSTLMQSYENHLAEALYPLIFCGVNGDYAHDIRAKPALTLRDVLSAADHPGGCHSYTDT